MRTGAMRISEITFMALFDDVKRLVADGVRNDIALTISNARDPEQRRIAISRGNDRESSLKTWLSKDRPLSYGQIDLNHTFTSLVKAVIADPDLISYGLPNFVEHAMTPTTFADSLIKMSSPLDPSPPAAPVLSNGSFLPLLKEAHRILLSLSQETHTTQQHAFIRLFFLRAIQLLRIRFVPSHRPRSARSGASPRVPVFNSWANLGVKDVTPIPSLPILPSLPSSSQIAADSALTNALATDANADWSIKEISIPKIHSILHKSSLPDDFATPSLTNVPYVDDTYAWVKSVYTTSKPLHHLALIVAIIASSFIPNLFPPKNIPKRLFHNANTPSQVHAVWNTLSWVKRDNKKGMSDRLIFISMFTTFIIALYEPNSPLRLHIHASSKNGLGDPWTNKHTVKGVTYTVLVRLGILWGTKEGAGERGYFNNHWGCDVNARFFCKDILGLSSRPPL
ncbi:hypothetical protein BJY52DRAFT_1226307 [Lactarius psammicola]|nr:hypothetical protein BJY52DRAFT_1226307 [Lactarius psammicola]